MRSCWPASGMVGPPRPADEQAISELPSDEFRSDQTDVEENEQAVCSICLTAFGKGDEISTPPLCPRVS